MKGFLSFKTLDLIHIPPDVTIQVVRQFDVWKFCLVSCFKKFLVYFHEELATFDYVVGAFLPRKFKFISENLKLVKRRKQKPFVVRPITTEKWKVRVEC